MYSTRNADPVRACVIDRSRVIYQNVVHDTIPKRNLCSIVHLIPVMCLRETIQASLMRHAGDHKYPSGSLRMRICASRTNLG